MQASHTAILFFSRTAAGEAAAKPLGYGQPLRKRLFGHLIRRTLSEARKSRLPLLPCYTPDQRGCSFGERLANAIENAFDQGYQQLIIIGNDCPQLTHQLIGQAKEQLSENQLVIGPGRDGGAYLIGLHRNAFQRERFIQLRWETDQLLTDLKAFAQQQFCQTCCLVALTDIDKDADLRFFLTSASRSNLIIRMIRAILCFQISLNNIRLLPLFSSTAHPVSGLRGPPASCNS